MAGRSPRCPRRICGSRRTRRSQGLALVDAPDVDSIEHANRVLADRLAEAADLGIFVTTATRYADRVPWEVLGRIRDRGLPLLVVVNRMPPDLADQRAVLDDLAALLRADWGSLLDPGGAAELIGVPEGALDPTLDGLDRARIAPVLERLAALRVDREARRELAARALAGALSGLGPLAHRSRMTSSTRRSTATPSGASPTRASPRHSPRSARQLSRGTFLREETLRQWHAFVGRRPDHAVLRQRHRPRPGLHHGAGPRAGARTRRGRQRDRVVGHRRPGAAPGRRGEPPHRDGVGRGAAGLVDRRVAARALDAVARRRGTPPARLEAWMDVHRERRPRHRSAQARCSRRAPRPGSTRSAWR